MTTRRDSLTHIMAPEARSDRRKQVDGIMEKHLPWNPELLAQVYVRLGAVVWQGQHVEDTLSKLIVLVFQVTTDEARELALDSLEKNKKLTLGALTGKLRTCAQLPEALDTDLQTFKDERNWVIHHSYADVLANLHDPKRLIAIVDRIEQTGLLGYGLTMLFWDVLRKLSDEFDAGGPIPSATAQQIREHWNMDDSIF